MEELLLFGAFLCGIDEKEAAALLRLPKKAVRSKYKEWKRLNVPQLLERIYEQPEENAKFLLLCLRGKKPFLLHYLGIERMDDADLYSLLAEVQDDPSVAVRLKKLALEAEKFKFQVAKSKAGAKEEELLDRLKEIGQKLFGAS